MMIRIFARASITDSNMIELFDVHSNRKVLYAIAHEDMFYVTGDSLIIQRLRAGETIKFELVERI